MDELDEQEKTQRRLAAKKLAQEQLMQKEVPILSPLSPVLHSQIVFISNIPFFLLGLGVCRLLTLRYTIRLSYQLSRIPAVFAEQSFAGVIDDFQEREIECYNQKRVRADPLLRAE